MTKTAFKPEIQKGLTGGVAGFLATLPMSLAMIAMHRILPVRHRYSLPPKKVTLRIARKLGIRTKLTGKKKNVASTLSHFGYGAAAGSVYGLTAGRMSGSPVAKGIGFGLLVWSGSYFGLLPAVKLWEPEEEHHKRYWMMAAAHVVWGGFLGLTNNKFRKIVSGAPHKKSKASSTSRSDSLHRVITR
jgi:putative membrane protein